MALHNTAELNGSGLTGCRRMDVCSQLTVQIAETWVLLKGNGTITLMLLNQARLDTTVSS
jgi:hypothetical protein